MIIVLFGVAGAGKTTVGKLLARDLGWRFLEADDFHPEQNIAKMRAGRPLTDRDRWPWLQRLQQEIQQCVAAGDNAVLACSALKRKYRDLLRANRSVKFVFLRSNHPLIEKRLRQRRRHFMNPHLLQSQFAHLEEPHSDENVATLDAGRSPRELVEEIKTKLCLARERY